MAHIKIRIPVVVTADGKWGANGWQGCTDNAAGEPDWGYIEELCDFEKPPINPQRYFVEAVIDLPDVKTAVGTAIPQPSGEPGS
jgi:hypothetical protein